MIDSVLEFLSQLDWLRVVIALIGTGISVVFGIYIPARILEDYTGQVGVKWIWYFLGTFCLVMVYISMFGYGYFWTAYSETRDQDPVNYENPREKPPPKRLY